MRYFRKKNCADAKWGGVGEKRFAILGADVAVNFAMEGFLAEGLGGFTDAQRTPSAQVA